MSIQGDWAREEMVGDFCRRLMEKIQSHPEAARVLKELGREVLDLLPAVPDWAHRYYQLFRDE